MSALAVEPEPLPIIRTLGFHDRACSVCGWRFFTTAALADHQLTCERPVRQPLEAVGAPTPVEPLEQPETAPLRRYRYTEAGLAAMRESGLRIAALVNKHRRRCVCGRESTPAGIGNHQKMSGHTGWTEA